jgi:hypothetical protein
MERVIDGRIPAGIVNPGNTRIFLYHYTIQCNQKEIRSSLYTKIILNLPTWWFPVTTQTSCLDIIPGIACRSLIVTSY